MAQADMNEAQRALIQAAQSAAEAVQQLQAAQAQSSASRGASTSQHGAAKFSNASKMVRMPDPFAGATEEQKFSQRPDFVLNLKAWLNAADGSFEQDLSDSEANMEGAVDLSIEQGDPKKKIKKKKKKNMRREVKSCTQYWLGFCATDHSRCFVASKVTTGMRYIASS